MEQHSQEIGTRRDLVVYRLETAKNDLRSARVLLNIEDYKRGRAVMLLHSGRFKTHLRSLTGANQTVSYFLSVTLDK